MVDDNKNCPFPGCKATIPSRHVACIEHFDKLGTHPLLQGLKDKTTKKTLLDDKPIERKVLTQQESIQLGQDLNNTFAIIAALASHDNAMVSPYAIEEKFESYFAVVRKCSMKARREATNGN